MNTFTLLRGAAEFQKALREAVTDCHQSFYSQFMTFEGDPSGEGFAHLLTDKVQSGVDVRLMVDYYSDVVVSDTYPTLLHRRGQLVRERQETLDLLTQLQQCGVKLQRTAPVGRMYNYILYRNHKKMIVLDEKVAFVGGLNISDHNYDWHDLMVMIEGPLVKDLVCDFCSTWNGETVPFDSPVPGGDFILNQCAGRYSILNEIIAMVDRAEESVVIQSPYLIGYRIEGALMKAARRGVRVDVIIPYRSNKLVYRIWVRKTLQNLHHPNITVHGFTGAGGMTHVKLVLVDGKHASFGSLNIMELEGLTQKELNVFTSNPAFIAQLETFIEDDLAQSQRLSIPRFAFGRITYNVLYAYFNWRTQRLLRNPSWRELYC
ncbi:MAG: phosphatidylserine/phosphatidylglycerophosphate/cardiolipin synthase family protein [Chloroflexi bacterium]|nr:phosphatidylserine/phosphatidylglycerophosphate/cardiolipin synthase family protein [Chloroflexota bacterium]